MTSTNQRDETQYQPSVETNNILFLANMAGQYTATETTQQTSQQTWTKSVTFNVRNNMTAHSEKEYSLSRYSLRIFCIFLHYLSTSYMSTSNHVV